MSGDARCVLTDEGRVRAQLAKTRGGLCGRCGRALAEGEAVWMERLLAWTRAHRRRTPVTWTIPVGEECASPTFRADTEGTEPERCVGCGRGVYSRADRRRRARALCSRRCAGRYYLTRARGAKEGA